MFEENKPLTTANEKMRFPTKPDASRRAIVGASRVGKPLEPYEFRMSKRTEEGVR